MYNLPFCFTKNKKSLITPSHFHTFGNLFSIRASYLPRLWFEWPRFRAGLDRTPWQLTCTYLNVKLNYYLISACHILLYFKFLHATVCFFYHIIHVFGTICRINFTILILLKICRTHLVRKREKRKKKKKIEKEKEKRIAVCNKLMLCFPMDFWKILEGRIFIEIRVVFHGFSLQLFSIYFQL